MKALVDRFALNGRVALVTGGVRGLGFEIARGLGECGARVVINGREEESSETAAIELRDLGLDVSAAAFDVSDENAAISAIDGIVSGFSRLDILVNNVGARFRRSINEIQPTDLRALLDVNLVAAYALARRAAPIMARGSYGRIINVGSVAAERGRESDLAYIVTKGALSSLTRALAAEFAATGVTCNTLLPGTFRTGTNRNSFSRAGMESWFNSRVLLSRPGEPEEIAGAAIFLASPAASYVTGTALVVDGGYLVAG